MQDPYTRSKVLKKVPNYIQEFISSEALFKEDADAYLYAYTKSGRAQKWLKILAESKMERLEKSDFIRFHHNEVPEMGSSKEQSIGGQNEFVEEVKVPAMHVGIKRKAHRFDLDALIRAEDLFQVVLMDAREPEEDNGALNGSYYSNNGNLNSEDEDLDGIEFCDMDELEIPDEEIINEKSMMTITG